jgi:hypothetical protein
MPKPTLNDALDNFFAGMTMAPSEAADGQRRIVQAIEDQTRRLESVERFIEVRQASTALAEERTRQAASKL